MQIKTYAIELNKRQRAMVKLNVPCDDALKFITYVDNMHKSGIFKERELLKWENDSKLQVLKSSRPQVRQSILIR